MTEHGVNSIPAEARAYQGRRAGIVSRVIANSVDFGVLIVILALGYGAWCALLFLRSPSAFQFPEPSFLVTLVIGYFILFVYFVGAWVTTGRTYGNHLMGLRVVNFRDERLRWPGAALRSGFCLFFPIGLFWTVVSRENRSIQDVALRTSVIYDWRAHLSPVLDSPESTSTSA